MSIKRICSISMIFFIISIIFVMITACSNDERYLFDEKKYVLREKPVEWTEDLIIDDAYINFTKITKEEYTQAESKTNLMQNRKNKEYYRIDFMLKFANYGEIHCDCDYLGRRYDMIDRYDVDISFMLGEKQIKIYKKPFTLSCGDSKSGSQATLVYIWIDKIYMDNQEIVFSEAKGLYMYAEAK